MPPPTKSHGSFARLTAWGASGGVAGYVATGRPFPLRSDAESTISSYFRLCTLEKSAASVEKQVVTTGCFSHVHIHDRNFPETHSVPLLVHGRRAAQHGAMARLK